MSAGRNSSRVSKQLPLAPVRSRVRRVDETRLDDVLPHDPVSVEPLCPKELLGRLRIDVGEFVIQPSQCQGGGS